LAGNLFNLAVTYAKQGDSRKALSLAQEAAQIFARIGHQQYKQQARQLVAYLQNVDSPSAKGIGNRVQQAFEMFQGADSPQAMQVAVNQYPFMIDTQFIQSVEEIITEQVPPEHKPAFELRLAWLKQIARK
jgi:hypothetical protein